MRNITLSGSDSYCVNDLDSCDCFYTNQGYILLYSKGRVIKFEEDDEKCNRIEICNLIDNLYPVSDEKDIPKAVDIVYLFEKNSIFIILYNGDLVSVEYNESTCSSDIVGSIEGGIKCARWSPEKEVLALVTGNDSVMVMTNDFEPVSEVALHGGGFGVKQFTTVGWGKKETQFRGSEGKYKDKSTLPPEPKDEVPTDDSVKISWRGDAELFVVSSLNPETSKRYLRIFSKEGILQFTSETVSGLEHALGWRPSGNLIASTQRLPNKHVVCFFEKNGLRHGEFTLPFKHNEVIVEDLAWNADSKLLAIVTEKIKNTPTESSIESKATKNIGGKCVLIYCSNNYHWYCKYSIPFASDCQLKLKWDEHVSNMLHVVLKTNSQIFHKKYKWLWTVNKSRGKSSDDKSFVAVIDGSKLLLTPFKTGILPPPFGKYSLEMESYINQVDFAPADDSSISSNDLFVLLSNGEIHLYKFELTDDKTNQMRHKFIGKIDYKTEFIYNVQWISSKTFTFCEKSSDSISRSFLNIVDMHDIEPNINFTSKRYPLKSSIALMKPYSTSVVLFHDNRGDSYLFDMKNESYTQLYPEQKRFLNECEVIQKQDKSVIVVGLDKSNRLFVNDRMIANNITSFHVHQDFLLLTNLKHKLLCVPFEVNDEKIIGTELNDVSTRRVENGSRIITSVAKGTKVILQMPRGNLECIQPRALSLSIIGKFLDELQFYEAFNIMRLQRINLNLLYDHNPNLFRENVDLFIEQINEPSWISLFLSELIDEDVTETMYAAMYKNKEGRNAQIEKSKTTVVCELLERALGRAWNSEKYVLPVLTTYIKRGETKYIEYALSKIKKIKESEKNGEKVAVTFDEAFKYLLYLIDVEDLYKVALGMYDFDLVLLVATKSQKDPQEYLPFLNDLRKLEVNYQKFMIDKYLKRYDKALESLLQCGGDDYFTECLAFIKGHKLHRVALKLVPHTTDRYKQICASYADELMRSHLYEEAGIMYSNSGSYASAISAFTKSGNWREVIFCSTKLKLTNPELKDLYMSLGRELINDKRYGEASVVYLDYLKDPELSIECLCGGKMFAEAFRIAELHHREDLVQAQIKPAILECYENIKGQMSFFRDLFDAQKKRLSVVREKKLLQGKGLGEEYDANNDQDMCSETSSTVTQSHASSRSTNRTFRSAKNKRKQERKLLSLKEGNPYEDLALIASLHFIVSKCLEMRTEIKDLNMCLIRVNEESLAKDLQITLSKVLKQIEDSRTEIWTENLLFERYSYGPETTSDSIANSTVQMRSNTPASLFNPRLLIFPEVHMSSKWELEILDA